MHSEEHAERASGNGAKDARKAGAGMRERSWVPTTFSSSSTLFSPGAADARLRLQFFDRYPSGATPVSALNATVGRVTNFRICSISLYGKRRGEQRDISTSDEELLDQTSFMARKQKQ